MPIIYPNTSDMINFGPITPGVYQAKCVEVESKTSTKGNSMIVPKFILNVDGDEKTRTAYLVVEGKGSGQFDQLLRACNFSDLADQLRAGEKVPFDTDSLIGQEVNVRIEHKLGTDGKLRDEIAGFFPA